MSAVTKRSTLFLYLLLLNLILYSQVHDLDYYINQGVANNPVLKDLSNQIRSNQYDSLITRASYLPQVSFNAMMMYAPVVDGWGYSDVITNGQELSGTLNVNQQIFNKKTREVNYQKVGLENRSLKNSRDLSINELKKAITAQYLSAYSALQESQFQQEILSTLKEEEMVLKMWVQKGTYRQTDYLSVKVEIIQLERNIKNLDLQYRKEFSNLNVICGLTDTAHVRLGLPTIEEILKKSPENSLFFRKFVIDSLKIQTEKLLIDRKYKPTVNWFSDGGLINNEPVYLYQNFGISFGMSLSLPVYDGNQRKYNYSKIRIQEETRKNYRDFFRAQYNAQLKQLKEELDNVRLLAVDNDRQVEVVKMLVAQERAELNSGTLTITDYILALKNLIEALHEGVQYQIRAQYILNEINFWKQ
ncbi:MAG: TolC family protein [Bacteroidetes bacterium]|nr:TolC family protein [Bacteroidota bacterium]